MKRILIGAAFVLGGVVCAPSIASAQDTQSTWRTTVSDTDMAEARKHFQAGVRLLDDPDGARYEDAYRAFKRAHDISKATKILSNIGFCAMHLERDGEAIEAYSTYLKEEPNIDPNEKTQIEKDLETLKSSVVRVKLKVKEKTGSFVLVDRRQQTRGNPIENEYPFEGNEIGIRLHPGRHLFKVRLGAAEATPIELTLEAGTDVTHEVVFPPEQAAPPQTTKPEGTREKASATGPIVVGAVGVVALAVGAVTGIMATTRTSSIADDCTGDTCPAGYGLADKRDSIKTLGTVTDIALIGGGVLLGGALLWYALMPKDAKNASTALNLAQGRF